VGGGRYLWDPKCLGGRRVPEDRLASLRQWALTLLVSISVPAWGMEGDNPVEIPLIVETRFEPE